MHKFDINQYFKIKRRIEEYDVYYSALYNLANIEYDDKIETACVYFDKEGNTLRMGVNYDFWQRLQEEEQIFVILHELSHIVLNHAKRIIDMELDFKIGNLATDIVINHLLNNQLGINRDMFDWKKYYWVETAFPKETDVPNNKNFEYYYQKLLLQKELEEKQLLGNHSEKSNDISDELKNTQQESEPLDNESENAEEQGKENVQEDILKEIIKQNPDMFKNTKGSIFNDEIEDVIKDIEVKDDWTHIDSPTDIQDKKHKDRFQEIIEKNEKPNFKNLMKLLTPKKIKKDHVKQTWVGQSRRYISFLKQAQNIYLPNEYEYSTYKKDKKEIWVFMDTSGSCTGLFPYFGQIIKELLKNKDINCRAFSFDDYCYEIKKNDKNIRATFGNNYGGFDCIENKILDIMKIENIDYPENVVVMSDGGVSFRLKDKLKKPQNWILLINNDYKQDLTPKGGQYFNIDKNFFSDKPSAQKFKR